MMKEAYPVIDGAESLFFEGNDTGVLLCHGFLGTPQSLREMAEGLADQGYTVSVPRLPGHGTHYKDLASCSFSDWYMQIETAYLQLYSRCREVFVIGQSMGGTLTLDLAAQYPGISGIALINPAMYIPALSHLEQASEPFYIEEGKPDIKDPGAVEITYTQTPLTAYQELLKYMKVVRRKLTGIRCPITCFVSSVDNVVPPENTDYILRKVYSNSVSKYVLENSYHVASMDYDKEQIIDELLSYLETRTSIKHRKKVSP